MKVLLRAALLVFTFFLTAEVARAERIVATLTGFEEVPAVATGARGQFVGQISRDETLIDYSLTYAGLEGTITQAHIHFGQLSINGSIVIWLCQTATNPSPIATTPLCPQEGTVTGTITEADVILANQTSQKILAGELAKVIVAIRAGAAYANVHSAPLTPSGEIRGQIRPRRR